VYRLKDLESILPKAKGIVSQSVKEVLQSLVDDGLVDSDKIGAGNFFWAFPSKATRTRQNKLEKVQGELVQLQANAKDAESRKRKALEGREDTEERRAKLAKLEKLRAEVSEADSKLKQYSSNDPAVVEEMKRSVDVAIAAANRWTDNVFTLISLFKQGNPELTDDKILKGFELPTDLDQIDLETLLKPPKKGRKQAVAAEEDCDD
jgi:hypothetical protein